MKEHIAIITTAIMAQLIWIFFINPYLDNRPLKGGFVTPTRKRKERHENIKLWMKKKFRIT